MKKIICIISVICILFSLTFVTSFAWVTKNDRYLESTSIFGNGDTSEKFVEKGIPAPIVDDPVPYAVKGRINIKLNGKFKYFANQPVLIDGRVLLPFRELFEFFDMSVSWDDNTRTATAKNDKTEIKITADETKAYVNGEEKILDVGAMLIDGRTYVPVRFIAENIGYSVSWDNRNEIVNLMGGGVK